ncbi:YigZ family protein [Dyella sp.]|uniref:IMPACT family protein n=1 Tax=Dyella sp. TaxID=1869338 RepID=UPI002ED54CA5
MSDALYTLAGPFEHIQDIKKSRFLARGAPARHVDEALDFVRHVSDPAATHNCWAYRIGQDYRFNDDGEPGGTAGRPILQAIEGQDIDQVIVVVTRWYGGIKLGAGGLVRAYGGIAAEGMRLAARQPLITREQWRMHCAFADLALLKSRLKDWQAQVDDEAFDAAGVTLTFSLPASQAADVAARIVDITRGRVHPGRLELP